MRKLLLIFVIGILTSAAIFGEEASVLPERQLRLGMLWNSGFYEDGGYFNKGYTAEYGFSNWINLQLFWNSMLKLHPDFGTGSIFFGVKGFILGKDAIISAFRIFEDGKLVPVDDKLRVSAAFGILVPPSDDSRPDLTGQDQMLWGSSVRLYGDFIVNKYFYFNAYYEWIFYPPQYENNPAYYGDWVRHYHDYTFELEAHGEIPLEKHNMALKFGVPVRFFCAPYMNASDEFATSQYFLSAGAYFGVKFTDTKFNPPAEMYLRYNAHVLGQNIVQTHSLSFIAKVTIPVKPRAKDNAKNNGVNAGEEANSESEVNIESETDNE